jgi:hypothetical protein
MKIWKVSPLIFIIIFVFLGMTIQIGFAQGLLGPLGLPWLGNPFYSPFAPIGGAYFSPGNIIPPFYGGNLGLGYPLNPISTPAPAIFSPFQRRPNATIIFTSPTLTSVSTAPGVIDIGATSILGAPTVVIPTVPAVPTVPTAVAASLPTTAAVANPLPAPLFSILSVLYASALLDGKALLSTANPLLFAYLQTLIF